MLDQAVSADFGDEQASGTPDSSNETLDLAFFRRGSKGKVVVDSCSLLPNSIMNLARAIRDLLRTKPVAARNLKTLLIRCDQQGNCVWQLYLKDRLPDIVSPVEAAALPAQGGELIYSDPRSPASRITERLAAFGDIVLTDTILGASFRYATEGFFQVNVPVYEQALRDMVQWVKPNNSSNEMSAIKSAEISSTPSAADSRSTDVGHEAVSVDFGGGQTSEVESSHPVLDLYSGVGTIGLTIGGDSVTLVEVNEDAVREMRRNIKELGRQNSARAILAPSEKALDYITSDATIIVDPPRAGLHADVIAKLLDAAPQRIIYLSCNPVTQARDVALLSKKYGVRAHQGYNFFPRTPHIEHLVILDRLTDISPHQT